MKEEEQIEIVEAAEEAAPEAPAAEAVTEKAEAIEEAPAEAPAEAQEAPSEDKPTASVVQDGKVVRAYTEAEHGEGYEGLAAQYAAKVGGVVSYK